jgi:Ca-activated chloride channel homolog
MKTELRLDHSTPVPGEHLVLRALLRITGNLPERVERAPMHLALVLDRSQSMIGPKMQHARDAAALLVRRLQPDDAVSVVCYDHEVFPLVSAARGSEAHEEAVRMIQAIDARGSTNLSGGWLAGRALLSEAPAPGGVNRILLMTDGLANQGIIDPHTLRELCRNAARHGITTTTIGFGEGYNEDLLRAMSDAGGGATWYVENADQAPGIFEAELEGLMGLAAQNVSVTVSPSTEVQHTALCHDYPHAMVEGGMQIQVGDLYAKEPRQVLMEFLLPPTAADEERAVAALRLTADVVLPEGGMEHRTIDLPIRLCPGHEPRVDPQVRQVERLLAGARAREEALERQARGDWGGAVRELREWASKLSAHPEDEVSLREARDLSAMAERLEEQQAFHASDIKYMKQRAWDSRRSREGAKERYTR